MAKVEKLLEPTKIGKMELKNRMIMPALCSKFGTEYGAVSDRLIDFYVERARGGVSLIVIENTCIDWPVGKAGTNPIRADDFVFIHGLHELAEAVHPYGTKIATQLQHTGRQGSSATSAEGQELIAPSAITCLPTGGEMPRELTSKEIETLIGKFVQGASITRAAGFDAVEIQGGHGYLINQFLSPYSNHRKDEYGGELEGRMRFCLRVIEGIRLVVGPDFPILFRMSADEHIAGGLSLEDNKVIAQRLVAAGVDAISVSAGIYESPPWYSRIFPVMGMPDGCNVPLAQGIKQVVDIPVIVAGKLGNPALAEEVLKEGKADLIAFGRSLLADPELPNQVIRGKTDEIRPCIYCNEACSGNISRMWRISCVVNPELGQERAYRIQPAARARRVVVVGGGPAGMEAARVASLRGHDTMLYEKDEILGGQLIAASRPPFKKVLNDLLKYFRIQMWKRKVKVELGREVTAESLKGLEADVVILATGAVQQIPQIPGIDAEHVALATDLLLGAKESGDRVVVVGGGEVGSEVAWFLAEQGKKVTIAEMSFGVASEMNMFSQFYLMDRLAELGVEIATTTTVEEVTEKGVLVSDMKGDRRQVEADTVVVATGFRSCTGLADSLKGEIEGLYQVGSCVKPGKIWEAVHEAFRIARVI